MYTEEQLLPLSALQHFVFCERRAALVFTEGLWAENQFTIEGTQLHERADDASQSQDLAAVRIERAVGLVSLRYGLTGKADVIEFHKTDIDGIYQIHVIEFKRGRPKKRLDLPFQVQLCAQALCVEDMLNCDVAEASIYYGKARQRKRVELDYKLRSTTIEIIAKLHTLIESKVTPAPEYKPRKCRRCSMINLCMPQAPRPIATASRYLQCLINLSDDEDIGGDQ